MVIMKQTYIVYPHQLFEDIHLQKEVRSVVFIEEPLLFKQFAFHKKKLIFHHAAMKIFAHRLKELGFSIIYVESHELLETQDIISVLKKNEITKVHFFDLVDDWLEKRIRNACKSSNIETVEHKSPNFYLDRSDIEKEFGNQSNFLMASFYIKQRKKFNILLQNGKPIGGKWSFDAENRKKLPRNIKLPNAPQTNENSFVNEAIKYVEQYFPKNPGQTEHFFFPVSHEGVRTWLDAFLNEKFSLFGTYQDAVLSTDSILFHSILSPLLNAGLLTPNEVVEKAITKAEKDGIPINCIEGFIRQIIGWREFVRGVYCTIGGKERTKNFWGHTRALPESFWNGTTGIEPVDNVILKVCETGYAHHIERLMIMANFMLLCEIHPDEVYRWFMELFIDAYDWVMVPNVYGMGQYADGGMITTKPYISGANYILKMSNFSKGEWIDTWNSLYWSFVAKHKIIFQQNPRCQPIIFMLDKMENSVRSLHLQRAENYLKGL